MTANPLPAVARRFLAACERIETGTLTVICPDGARHRFGQGAPEAEFQIRDWSVVSAVAARGDIGLGETYAQGLWDSPDIETLIALGLLNEAAFDSHAHGTWLSRMGFVLVDRVLRRNSRSGSSRNIRSHYDVGNEFYGLWLDPSMTYSSALYGEGDGLEQAQHRKYDRLLDLTEQASGGRTLEIGCGWGGFAERAAERGRDVTAVTISPSQRAYAQQRLGGRAEVRLQDYRDIRGAFDAIASIEMIEAVGERYWPVYFRTIKQRLAEGGRATIQAITVSDSLFPQYRRRSDYIRHYVFPGGMLLSPGRIEAAARKAGLEPGKPFFFGQSYARTLRDWLDAFDAAADRISALGYDSAFQRSWRFYLQICAAAFAIERTDVVHYAFRHAEETVHA